MSFYDPPRAYDSRFDAFARQQRTPMVRNTTSVYLRPSAATPAIQQTSKSIGNNNYNNVESRYLKHFPKTSAGAAKITTTTTTSRTTTVSKPSAPSNTPIVRSETFTKVDHPSKPVGRSDTFTVKNPKSERVKVKKVVTMNPGPDQHSDYSTFTKRKVDGSSSNGRSYSVSPEKYGSGVDSGTYRKTDKSKQPSVVVIDYGTYRKSGPRYDRDASVDYNYYQTRRRDSHSQDSSSPEKPSKGYKKFDGEKKEKRTFFSKSPSRRDSSTERSDHGSYQNLSSSGAKTRSFLKLKSKGRRDISPSVKLESSPSKGSIDSGTYRKSKPTLYSRFSSPRATDLSDRELSPDQKKRGFFSKSSNKEAKRDRSTSKENYHKLGEETTPKKQHSSLFSKTMQKANKSKGESYSTHSLPAKSTNASNGRIDNLIKRFEKHLQTTPPESDDEVETPHADQKSKPSNSISGGLKTVFEPKGSPKYRDIGIECKMDDELQLPAERKSIRSLSPFKFFSRMKKTEAPDTESLVQTAVPESPKWLSRQRNSIETPPLINIQDSPPKARKQWFGERDVESAARHTKPVAVTSPYMYESCSIDRSRNTSKPIRVEFYRPKHKDTEATEVPIDREKFQNFRDSFRKYKRQGGRATVDIEENNEQMDVDDPVLSKQTFFVAF